MRDAAQTQPVQSRPAAELAYWRAAVALVAGMTLVRLTALFATPLQLYPDEAQYWLWSRTLDFGYYSKPPMVAWAIWATTHLGGDAEPWVRLASPLFQAGATFFTFLIGRRLYGPAAGLAAAALYALMPGVQLSGAIIATDAPLLCFLGLTLVAYVRLPHTEGRARLLTAAGFGAALGLAFLSKYAAVYAIIGLVLHLVISRDARRAWTPAAAVAALLAFAAALTPNIVWNAQHGFATVQHTASNAAWGGRQLFNPAELGSFVASQFGVFGPIPFAVLVGGTALLALRRRLQPADLLLLCFALPPLLIVMGQAFISRANANWSGAGYLPGAVLVGAWLVRWRARRWLAAAIAIQAVIAALFFACVIQPRTADLLGASNSFKRARGWSELTRIILDRAQMEGGVTAIAVNSRFLYNAMAYYGRDAFADPHSPPLTVWLLEATPQNQAETDAPLTPRLGGRVLAVAMEGVYAPEMKADFQRVLAPQIVGVMLDRKHRRKAELFVGEGFTPRPRPVLSGRPTPP